MNEVMAKPIIINSELIIGILYFKHIIIDIIIEAETTIKIIGNTNISLIISGYAYLNLYFTVKRGHFHTIPHATSCQGVSFFGESYMYILPPHNSAGVIYKIYLPLEMSPFYG
jgi:hypothetical protein